MSKWQPIETAPKDGTDIILYQPEPQPSWTVCGYWSGDNNRFEFCAESDKRDLTVYVGLEPSHWMHLPAAPK